MAMRGVNLGGWLILERWMTPTVFEGTDANDEFTFMQTPGALAKLRQHHKTFITKKDFEWMAQNKIEIVRIPVGYWVLDGDKPYASSTGRLDWAFKMCEQYGIKVLLDVHGLPGSQNGHDHSGKSGRAMWYKDSSNRKRGLDATLKIAERYASSPVLWGFQMMNEPRVGFLQIKLRRYYNQAYKKLTTILPAGVKIVFSDAFTPRLMSAAVWSNKRNPAYMDIHWYHFVGWGRLKPNVYKHLIAWHGRLIKSLRKWNGIIIGEWSGCYSQRIFDKYPVSTHNEMVRVHIERQLKAYRHADAWFYWSYKTEQPGVWNYKSLVDDGIVTLK